MKDVEAILYAISHDLKAPLRKVQGFATLLDRKLADELDPEHRELLDFITEGAVQLDHMLEELLVYSRIGRKEEQHKEVDLNGVLEAISGPLRIHGEITWDELPQIHGEPNQVVELLTRLVDNGVRYGRQVHVAAVTDGDMHQITLQDGGEGISDHARAVALFRRLEPARDTKSVGMGLPIAERIVERHGGALGFDVDPSRVWFKWPANPRES